MISNSKELTIAIQIEIKKAHITWLWPMDGATEYITRALLNCSIEGREEPFGTLLEQYIDAPKHFFAPLSLRLLRKSLVSCSHPL